MSCQMMLLHLKRVTNKVLHTIYFYSLLVGLSSVLECYEGIKSNWLYFLNNTKTAVLDQLPVFLNNSNNLPALS